jgi:zinc transport system permease protein
MFDDFMVRASFAGVGVAIAAAPLGCFVIWRRMAFFGDATAHAAILGVALSLALSTSIFAGVLIISLLMALAVSTLAGRGYAMDTLLGVMSHSALAFGLVAVSFISGIRIDLMAYLFGDILAVGTGDLAVIWVGAAMVLALIGYRWTALLTATLSPDLAYASGISPKREQLFLTLSLAVVVAVAIKVVGALLISAMLIIPAATARPFSRTPEAMAAIAICIGCFVAVSGLQASYAMDTPTGPTIVCVAALLFALSGIARLITIRPTKGKA